MALSDRLQVNSEIVVKRFGRIRLVEVTVEEMADVFAVDHSIFGRAGSSKGGKRWQDIQCAGQLVAGNSSRNSSGTPHDGWDSYAAFEG